MDLTEELFLKREDSWTTLHRPSRIILSFPGLKSSRFMKMDKEYNKGISPFPRDRSSNVIQSTRFLCAGWQIFSILPVSVKTYWNKTQPLEHENCWHFLLAHLMELARHSACGFFPLCLLIRKRHWHFLQSFSQLSFSLRQSLFSVLLSDRCKTGNYGTSYF